MIALSRRARRILIGVAIGVAVVGAGAFTYYELLKAAFIHYGKYDRRERGSLKVGGVAPDLELAMFDGTPIRFSQLWGKPPVFVVFGSCT